MNFKKVPFNQVKHINSIQDLLSLGRLRHSAVEIFTDDIEGYFIAILLSHFTNEMEIRLIQRVYRASILLEFSAFLKEQLLTSDRQMIIIVTKDASTEKALTLLFDTQLLGETPVYRRYLVTKARR